MWAFQPIRMSIIVICHLWKLYLTVTFHLLCVLLELDPDGLLFCKMLRACGLPTVLVTSSRVLSSLPCKPGSHLALYSQSPPYGHLVNMVTMLFQPLFCPFKKPIHFLEENPVDQGYKVCWHVKTNCAPLSLQTWARYLRIDRSGKVYWIDL